MQEQQQELESSFVLLVHLAVIMLSLSLSGITSLMEHVELQQALSM